jgi:hypothetical protein
MKERVAAMIVEADGRKRTRPVLRGEPSPGNAWDEYRTALAIIQERNLVERRFTAPQSDRPSIEDLLPLNADVLEHLRKGVQRNGGQFPQEWEKGGIGPPFSGPITWPAGFRGWDVSMLIALTTSQARVWLDQGRTEEAFDLLLDLCMFGSDLGFNAGGSGPSSLALSAHEDALREIRPAIQSGKAPVESLDRLSRELAILDRVFPELGPSIVNEALITGVDLIRLDEDQQNGVAPTGVKAEAVVETQKVISGPFFRRMVYADAFLKVEAAARQFEHCDGKPFAELKREADAFSKESEAAEAAVSSTAAIARVLRPTNPIILFSHRETLARFRVLRAVVEYLRNGQDLKLDDPFGGKILVAEQNGRVRAWSIGPDQMDNGGRGEWYLKRDVTGDIVLEVELRHAKVR